ncbi:M3 family metallopeptidase [Luteimonas kalidii]|uniref:Zn-dependent oligopeptidase n=1 Tax=Luteimonas kalidii TaxID=3042025 RepID=A0ABT6JRU5_9GAMM|nr:M3 family metallopeptidase [Luteimonas kalidii]MDH5833408.1 Zn-dependent oligopeptidase [Luteimonas kalidii]
MHRIVLLSCLVAAAVPAHGQPAASARLTVEPMLTPASVEMVDQTCDRLLAQASDLRDALETDQATPSLGTLRQYDDLWTVVGAARRDANLLASTSPDAAIRAAGRACLQRATQAQDAMQLSRRIHDRLKAIPLADADAETRHVLTRRLADFDRAGVSRDEATRTRIATLNDAITALEIRFAENIANGRRTVVAEPAELEGLPADYLAARKAGADGRVVISTDTPDLTPVMNYARSDALRRRLNEANQTRAPENDAVLRELIAQRDALARLLGRPDFPSLHQEGSMVDSPARVQSFLAELARAGDGPARADLARMLQRLQREQPGATTVPMWSEAYLTQLIKKEEYDLDPQEVRRYFSYDHVRDGLLQLTRDLMGVEIRPWRTPVWDPSVESYEMLDGGQVIGRFYFDTHPRPGKFNHAAVFGIRPGVAGGSIPVAALVTSFPAGGHETGLMEHRDVEVFLHEYGHLIHAMLSGGKRYALSAMGNLEPDFMEAPSKMLENFIWDYDTLARFAVDESGRTIPRELVERMNRARYFGEALRDRRQISLANASLAMYLGPPEADLTARFTRAYDAYALLPYPAGVQPQNAFPHLAPYPGTYYTYMWSQTLALDMFARFEREGVRNPAVARDYRDKVLGPGGSMPAAALVEGFLGRPASLEAYRARLAKGQ